MADQFDAEAYRQEIMQRAEAAGEAARTEELETEVQKNPTTPGFNPQRSIEPVWGFTKKLPKNIGKATYLGLLATAETVDDIAGLVGTTADMSGAPGSTAAAGAAETEEPEEQKPLPEVAPAQTLFPEVFEAAHTFANDFNEDATTADFITQGIAQFAIPFTGWLKLIGGLKGASTAQKVGRALTAEAAAVGTAFDPQEARVADVLAMGREMENKFGRVLNMVAPDGSAFNAYINRMTDRENEGKWEGRLKNIVDSLTVTGAAAGLIKAVPMTFRAARKIAEEAGTTVPGSPKAQRGSLGVRRTPSKLTPAEKSFFDEIWSSEPDRLELVENVPSARLTDEGLFVDPKDALKLREYVDETVRLERGEGRRLPPSFYKDTFAEKFDPPMTKEELVAHAEKFDMGGDELTDIERARALKNTEVEEIDGEHIVLEGDDLNTDAEIVPIDKDKK